MTIFTVTVKRFSAIISLLALSTLFVEVTKLPPLCVKQSEKKCAMMVKMNPNCKMMADMMKKHGQRKGKCNSKDCPDCPFFAVTLFKGMIVLSIRKPFNKTEYSVMLNNNLSDYHSPQWKPPDVSLI